MVLTHVNSWYYTHAASWLSFFTLWGASICYVTFVFAYGIGYGKQFIRKGLLDTSSTLKRLGALLLGYYFVAVWLSSFWAGRFLNIKEVLRIIFFIELPSYTEFLPTFVFFGVILLIIQKPLQSLLKRPILSVSAGILIYGAATYLFSLNWSFPAGNILKGLLVGYGNLNRWGILSYFPVFLWGITWGSRFDPADRAGKIKLGLLAAGIIGFFVLRGAGVTSERWPPSVPYLLWGLSYSLGILTLWPVLAKIKYLVSAGVFMGKNAFDFFIWHTVIIITSVAVLIPYRSFDEVGTLVALGIVLAVNSLIALRHKLLPIHLPLD